MVTGSNHTNFTLKADADFSSESLKSSNLITSLSPTGFSLIVASQENNQILLSAHQFWPEIEDIEKLLAQFEKCLGKLNFKVDEAAERKVLINYNKFSLVPQHLYEKEQGPAILSYTCKLKKGDHIYSDHWKQTEAILVYASPLQFVEWIQKHFPKAIIAHQGTAMEYMYQISNKEEQFAYLHVNPGSADFYLADDGKLQSYNNFDFGTDEDLLYFILYSLEQNRISPAELKLHISGHTLKGDKLQVLLDRYVSQLIEMDLPLGFSHSTDISPQEVLANFNLIGLL